MSRDTRGMARIDPIRKVKPLPSTMTNSHLIQPAAEHSTVFILAFYFSFFLTYLHHHTITLPSVDEKIEQHQQYMKNQAPNPYHHRILLHGLVEIWLRMSSVALDAKTAFIVSQAGIVLITTCLSLYLFYFYLRNWFSEALSLLGMSWLAAIQPFTYMNYHYQPTSYAAMMFCIIGFQWMYQQRRGEFAVLLLVSALNRIDTAIFLFAFYFFIHWDKTNRTFWLSLIGYAIEIVSIHAACLFFMGSNPMVRSFAFYPKYNLTTEGSALVALIYGPLWIWPFLNRRLAPPFLRRALWFVIPFVAIHFCVAKINEVRYFIPLAPVLTPLSLGYLFGWSRHSERAAG